MAAPHFGQDDFDKKVLESKKPAVIDFYAEWCGPCQMAAPIIDALADEHTDVVIGKVNVDENQSLAQKYGVMSIPTMVIFKDGAEVDRKIGFPGKEGLEKLVNDLAGK